MPEPTPGEICYGMYQRRLHNLTEHIPLDYPRPFSTLSAAQKAAWEAAAQAVRADLLADIAWAQQAPSSRWLEVPTEEDA